MHRILRVLSTHHYLAQDGRTGRFRLGLGALELGRNAQEGLELRRCAGPILHQLTEASGETVLLMVLNETRDRSVCIERVESRSRLRLTLEIGTHAPLYAGSSSKILLAHMAPEEIDRVVAAGLTRLARGTITSPAVLRRDLARIRAQGHAVSREETNDGAAGVSTAILDRDGTILAGLSIVGPLARFSDRQIARHVALARRGAAEIGRALLLSGHGGHAGPAAAPAARTARR